MQTAFTGHWGIDLEWRGVLVGRERVVRAQAEVFTDTDGRVDFIRTFGTSGASAGHAHFAVVPGARDVVRAVDLVEVRPLSHQAIGCEKRLLCAGDDSAQVIP